MRFCFSLLSQKTSRSVNFEGLIITYFVDPFYMKTWLNFVRKDVILSLGLESSIASSIGSI